MRSSKTADLCINEFRQRCRAEGFCHIPPARKFIDVKFPRSGYVDPVMSPRNRMLRKETLEKLLQHRARCEAEARNKLAEMLRKQALCEKLAPHVLPPARTTLSDAPAIRQLAEDMRSAAASVGHATWRGLLALGWSADQLKRYGDQARQTACELEGAV